MAVLIGPHVCRDVGPVRESVFSPPLVGVHTECGTSTAMISVRELREGVAFHQSPYLARASYGSLGVRKDSGCPAVACEVH